MIKQEKFRFDIPAFSNYVVLSRWRKSGPPEYRMIHTPEQCNRVVAAIYGDYNSNDPDAVRNLVWSMGRQGKFIDNHLGEYGGLNELFEGDENDTNV